MYYYEVIEMYRRIVLLGVLPVSYSLSTTPPRPHGVDTASDLVVSTSSTILIALIRER